MCCNGDYYHIIITSPYTDDTLISSQHVTSGFHSDSHQYFVDMDDCLMNIWINIQFSRENLQIPPAILSSKYLNYTDRGTELHVRQHYGDCSIVALYHCQYGNISIDQCLVTGCWWQWDNCMTTWSVHDTLRHWNIVILSTCIFSIV